jgi:hypothetical protein
MDRDEPLVDCDVHGRQEMAIACTHIAHGLLDGTTPGFVIAPEGEVALPNAWCDECEAMVEDLGGDWSEEASERAGFKILCAGCYGEAKGIAISANRFRNIRSGFYR